MGGGVAKMAMRVHPTSKYTISESGGAKGKGASEHDGEHHEGSGLAEQSVAQKASVKKMQVQTLEKVAGGKLIFDAHCHVHDYMQKTEGLEALSDAMVTGGIGYAMLTGTPLKKMWIGQGVYAFADAGGGSNNLFPSDQEKGLAPQHHLYDDGDLYPFTECDSMVFRLLDQSMKSRGLASIAKFSMTACGFNLGDFSVGDMAKDKLESYPVITGLGEIVLQSDDINNMTIKGGNWTFTEPSVLTSYKLHVTVTTRLARAGAGPSPSRRYRQRLNIVAL